MIDLIKKDFARCAGIIKFGIESHTKCKKRDNCKRFKQIFIDRENNLENYQGISVIMNCENFSEFLK